MGRATRIAVVSDSHGLWRPEILPVISDADLILHAGDVGRIEVLERLAEVAPVEAIRGNVDIDGAVAALPESYSATLGGMAIHMIHAIGDLAEDPAVAGWHVVICGHSHRPSAVTRDGVLYLNPGAVGPRRFGLPITLAHLRIDNGAAAVEIVTLDV